MTISRFRSLWGLSPGAGFQNWAQLFPELKRRGYAGVEIDISGLETEDDYVLVRQLAETAGLHIIALLFSSWPRYDGLRPYGLTVQDHLGFYRTQLEIARTLGAVKCNAQSGSDIWAIAQSIEFYQNTLRVDAEMGFAGRVSHETHRNRSLYSPYAADAVLREVPELHITADFSHWMVICERILEHPEDEAILKRVIPHVRHIHARIGTTQASQCPEPLNPVFARERAFFESIWRHIIEARYAADGADMHITFDPEYGPFPYHPINSVKTFDEVANEEGERLQELFSNHLRQISGDKA
ncbi:hypothetical protein BX600DRAFT_475274 [Xylariales sp. PMI_506]|nr:hypothetical protein BX600DRAFT_475274 [Xylariales sp. PMI_506]